MFALIKTITIPSIVLSISSHYLHERPINTAHQIKTWEALLTYLKVTGVLTMSNFNTGDL